MSVRWGNFIDINLWSHLNHDEVEKRIPEWAQIARNSDVMFFYCGYADLLRDVKQWAAKYPRYKRWQDFFEREIFEVSNKPTVIVYTENFQIREKKLYYKHQFEFFGYLLSLKAEGLISDIVLQHMGDAVYREWEANGYLPIKYFISWIVDPYPQKKKATPVEDKFGFTTYNYRGNGLVQYLQANFPLLVAEHGGKFPLREWYELVDKSVYLHTMEAGGWRCLHGALLLSPALIYIPDPQSELVETDMRRIEDNYLAQILSIGNQDHSWKSHLLWASRSHEFAQLVRRIWEMPAKERIAFLMEVYLKQKIWLDNHRSLWDLNELWDRWTKQIGFEPPADLLPFIHMPTTYMGDSHEVYDALFPSGPWENVPFSVNYPQLERRRAEGKLRAR